MHTFGIDEARCLRDILQSLANALGVFGRMGPIGFRYVQIKRMTNILRFVEIAVCVCCVIAGGGADLIQSRNYRTFEGYFVVAVIYLAMAICLRRLAAKAGTRLFAGRAR